MRFKLLISAIYFNPTKRCTPDYGYCHLSREARKRGHDMDLTRLMKDLAKLKGFFVSPLPEGARSNWSSIAANPLLAKTQSSRASKSTVTTFASGCRPTRSCWTRRLSTDGPTAEIADRTRRGTGVFAQIVKVLEQLIGYHSLNIITTATKENVRLLPKLVAFFHAKDVTNALPNPVRGMQLGGCYFFVVSAGGCLDAPCSYDSLEEGFITDRSDIIRAVGGGFDTRSYHAFPSPP